jgi:hypothetical protein
MLFFREKQMHLLLSAEQHTSESNPSVTPCSRVDDIVPLARLKVFVLVIVFVLVLVLIFTMPQAYSPVAQRQLTVAKPH